MIMRVEAVERRSGQKDVNGGSDELRLGGDGTCATLRVKLDVSARSGVNALNGPVNLPGGSGNQFNFLEREAQLPIPAQTACRQRLGHGAFQPRPLGKNQLMVGGKDRLGDNCFNGGALVVIRRA